MNLRWNSKNKKSNYREGSFNLWMRKKILFTFRLTQNGKPNLYSSENLQRKEIQIYDSRAILFEKKCPVMRESCDSF